MKVRNIQSYSHTQNWMWVYMTDLAKEKSVGGCLEVVTF